ncbi:hypothetical protein GUITHDRAFT_119417 [Guillardia theta CCMP2712]|uniref:Ubiquitin-like protease family profile domain-containing protein n=1 Tax=Guillardia theta (strain CCMP2712) TaxID=905079 RepID=L1IDV7_GUITC|nr:hypothetical protein GUITHDRAFT_119417 [Guillardia theta CCMP2712]EKX34413.1 hypothetical protein GUITHDRAFT_119417 [Guillardia theta CCMP2712]|eukprot:XP_005821393.1 hypothetical protein GUITHDRAFT_119417 [Guillardia theta CCMP2712]
MRDGHKEVRQPQVPTLHGTRGYVLKCTCLTCPYNIVIARKYSKKQVGGEYFTVKFSASTLYHHDCTSQREVSVAYLIGLPCFRIMLRHLLKMQHGVAASEVEADNQRFLKYLRYKWQTDDSLESTYEKRVMREGQVPIQEDSTSCAIFLCVIANNVAAGEGIDNFGQKDIPLIRQGIAKLLRGLYGYGNWDEADGNGSRGSDTGSGVFHQAKASHSEPAAATAEVRVMSAIEIM